MLTQGDQTSDLNKASSLSKSLPTVKSASVQQLGAPKPPGQKKGLSKGAIIGIIVGCILFTVLVVIVIIVIVVVMRKMNQDKEASEKDIYHRLSGKNQTGNPMQPRGDSSTSDTYAS